MNSHCRHRACVPCVLPARLYVCVLGALHDPAIPCSVQGDQTEGLGRAIARKKRTAVNQPNNITRLFARTAGRCCPSASLEYVGVRVSDWSSTERSWERLQHCPRYWYLQHTTAAVRSKDGNAARYTLQATVVLFHNRRVRFDAEARKHVSFSRKSDGPDSVQLGRAILKAHTVLRPVRKVPTMCYPSPHFGDI